MANPCFSSSGLGLLTPTSTVVAAVSSGSNKDSGEGIKIPAGCWKIRQPTQHI